MKNILVIGAGRSSASLIDYLLGHAPEHQWMVTVADADKSAADARIGNNRHGKAVQFNSSDEEARRSLIAENDFVISMLPAFMHADVAADCVEMGKHVATASYVSPQMQALDATAKAKKLLLLNECGLDPGIDHASAMKMIDEIKASGGEITAFHSYCGGLVAPESNDNPWGYKFSWNPRNVVLAGQGTAQYLQDGQLRFIPYSRVFKQTETIEVGQYGRFDAYANRDSIGYIDAYGLKSVKTMLRGTLRQHGFCKAWNVLVQLGLTDDTMKIRGAGKLTYGQLVESFLPPGNSSIQEKIEKLTGGPLDKLTTEMLDYLELFTDKKIAIAEGTAAEILQALLEEKWKLKEGDKDMIVLQHQFGYVSREGVSKKAYSSLVVTGKDQHHTAMALTVGLPLAITVKNFLTGKFALYGVQIPTAKAIYEPMLQELEQHGVVFKESSE